MYKYYDVVYGSQTTKRCKITLVVTHEWYPQSTSIVLPVHASSVYVSRWCAIVCRITKEYIIRIQSMV